MPEVFSGRWRLRVTEKNAGFDQRVRITGADSGSGVYPGVPGTTFEVSGNNWTATLEWNDGAGSGWQESAVLRSVGSLSPLVIIHVLGADDNVPAERDNDFDDLIVVCEDLDPIFDVVQRPFALDRGALTMMPDGIFDTSQGIQYMGVRIRNTWEFDWGPGTGVMIGVAGSSRTALASQGIQVIDSWSGAEQLALQQQVTGGFVRVPSLGVGEERILYFKVDVSNAAPGKPTIKFVARRDAWDPAYDQLTRQVGARIFISRSTYDPAARELVAEIPEGTVYMRLNRVIADRDAMRKAMRHAMLFPCRREPPKPGRRGGGRGGRTDLLQEDLRELLEGILAGKNIDPCKLREILDACCDGGRDGGDGGGGDPGEGPGDGGLGDGPGADNWCRYRPFHWLPVEFEYRIVPNPAYSGQFGPLAFEDPWWKVVLIILAALLAAASLIYDYIFAGQDPNFVIGRIVDKSDRATSNVDAAVALLNGSRGIDMDALDAQGDDRNNGLPVDGATGGDAAIDRSDNGDRGIADAVLSNIVFKSGARSGTTRGVVSSISLDTDVDGNFFTNQVLITQLAAPDDQPLSQGGDSGSIWVDLTSRRPVALNFAGPADDSGVEGIANPIRDVVTLFDIHFNS